MLLQDTDIICELPAISVLGRYCCFFTDVIIGVISELPNCIYLIKQNKSHFRNLFFLLTAFWI